MKIELIPAVSVTNLSPFPVTEHQHIVLVMLVALSLTHRRNTLSEKAFSGEINILNDIGLILKITV